MFILFYVSGDNAPTLLTVKARLIKRYGEGNIKFSSKSGSGTIITFRDSEYIALKQSWLEKNKDKNEERLKILKAAASIIRNDINSKECDTTFYPASDTFLNDVKTNIPESLQFLINEIILKGKKET